MNKQACQVRKVSNPPDQRPLMVFDGDCGFCRVWIGRWRESTGGNVDFAPYQEVSERYPEIPVSAFKSAVQFIEPDGSVSSGADAVFRALDCSPGKFKLHRLFLSVPGARAASRVAYRFIAEHRGFFSLLTRLILGSSLKPASYLVARGVFVRLTGLVYLIAFASLPAQIPGLIGKHGISPAAGFLQAVKSQVGRDGYFMVPTVCWFNAGDSFMVSLCVIGVALSCAVAAGFLPALCLFVLWGLYLSLVSVGAPFLNFQWDALLLQTGFLAIFLAPPGLWPQWKVESGGSRAARWLLLWLLFCLMFESGVVKLTSGDDTWRDLTALTYHYQTQPLPIWTSWYMNQAPLWFQTLSVMVMFAIELIAPFSIFGPRMIRRAGCAALIALQVLIAATGNYCFFNLLTVALCLLLLDDDAWPAWCRAKLPPGSPGKGMQWPAWLVAPVAVIDLLLSTERLTASFRTGFFWPQPVLRIAGFLEPLRTFNGYGLFAVMTKTRPEIIVEGSSDGEHWLPYEFKWKVGDITRRPALVAPYQPRLDWQMWFAALGSYRENPWFISFLVRLLQGQSEVTRLLASNPFPDAPPRYVRASLYDYKFTRSGENAGAWWKREYRGAYCPPISLQMLQNAGDNSSP
jgi:predicted DCC family thiol-disulfide oxidoreductase YuxK